MLIISRMSLSTSTFTLNSNSNNKRKRSSSMVAIAPLLQRIKKSFVHQHSSEGYSTARRSVHYCPQEEFDEKSATDSISTEDEDEDGSDIQPKFYALNGLERHSKNYVQPAENWWSSTPPLHSNQSVMIC